jgi:hypothetical protein
MAFHIGSQQAGVINNVDGNQTVHGGQNGSIDRRELLGRVRSQLAALALPAEFARQVDKDLDAIDADLSAPRPDHKAAADRLGRVVGSLTSAGVVARAGAGLLTALTALVNSFGHLGEPVRQLLGL